MMKFLSKHNLAKFFLTGGVALVMTLVVTNTAFAGWNNAPSGDCPNVTIGNVTTGQGISSPCWNGSNISAKTGDTINVAVYFHNTSTTTENNVSVKITNPGNYAFIGNKTFSGELMQNGSVVASGSASVNLTDKASLRLTKVVVQRQSTGGAVEQLSNPEAIFSGSGINIGSVAPGWNGQGVVKAVFAVEGKSDVSESSLPSVTTYTAQPISNELGNATLRGYFNANGNGVTTWFRYKRNNGSWYSVGSQYRGNTSGNYSYQLTGLASGNYEFQAVAENSGGTKYGNSQFFTITNDNQYDPCDYDDCDDNDDGDIYEPTVETRDATNVDDDSATLRGRLIDNGNDTNKVYFEWGTSSGNLSHTTSSQNLSSETTFSRSISGLDDNRTYYFRACTENDAGDDCGSVESFRTDSSDNDDDNDDTSRPSVTTLGTVSVGSTSATVDGYFTSNGCSTTTYFQYGRTSSLGSETSRTNRGRSSGSMAYGFTNLASSTTYYYRAVAEKCEGTSYGSTRSFTTGVRSTTTTTTTIIDSGTGLGGNSMVRLTITNNREIVRNGREVAYDVTWTNISGRTLENLVLEVNLPEQMKVLDTDLGSIKRNTTTVVYEIDSLNAKETGEMTITAEVSSGLREGDPVVAQAIMAFENPRTTATENAIAYDADEFSSDGSVLGASLFGLGFFPTSLAGWLIILLIILIIILIARYFMRKNDVVVNVQEEQVPSNIPTAGANSQDHIVYRPTPKQ